MGKTKIVILGLLILPILFLLHPDIEAYGSKITHPHLTYRIAEVYNQIYSPKLTVEQIRSLMAGSTDEDIAPRWVNHFFDPTTGEGWLGKKLGGMPGGIETLVTGAAYRVFGQDPVSTLDWVNNQDLQNTNYSYFKGDRTFNSAVLYSLEGNEGQSYYTLGFILHDLEDMSVPAHTRQDTHLDIQQIPEAFVNTLVAIDPNINREEFNMGLDQGDPYEKWADETGFVTDVVVKQIIKNYRKVCYSLSDCITYLANFSNSNFFSQDSVLDWEYGTPKVAKYVPSANIVYAYSAENRLLFVAEKEGDELVYIRLNHQSYFNELAPEAIMAGVEVVKYFHDQVEKVKTGELVLERPSEISFFEEIVYSSLYEKGVRAWDFAKGVWSFIAESASALGGSLVNSMSSGNAYETYQTPVYRGMTFSEAVEYFDMMQEREDLYFNRFVQPVVKKDVPKPEVEVEEEVELIDEGIIEPVFEEELFEPEPVVVPAAYYGGGGTAYPKLLITEVLIGGNDPKDEFVEVYNPSTEIVNLNGWYLQKRTKTSQSYSTFASKNVFEEKVIPPGGYFLIARSEGTYSALADVVIDSSLAEDNTLALKNPSGGISDKVGWGDVQDYEGIPADNPVDSLARMVIDGEYADTDVNLNDFENQNPSPRMINIHTDEPEPPDDPEEPDVPETDELAPSILFTVIPQRVLSFPVTFTIIDGIQGEVSPSGLAAFQFRYTTDEDWQEDPYVEIQGAPNEYSASIDFTAQDQTTYYLQARAKDLEGNESLWLPEDSYELRVREEQNIVINEVQQAGQSVDDEFIELYNPNQFDIDLSGYSLKKKTSSGTESNLVSASKFSGTIPASGYFLIVPLPNEDLTPNYTGEALPDLFYSFHSFYFAKDNTILLYDNYNTLLDKVGFGTAQDSETAPTVNPETGQSIERKINGKDTDNNLEDFRISAVPTPKGNATVVSIRDATEYLVCGVESVHGTWYYNLDIQWASLSSVDHYEVQYNWNGSDWKDWLNTQDTGAAYWAPFSLMYDSLYIFRARAQDTDGNMGDWQELTVDLSTSVVINEIAMVGTDASEDDIWIELYNRRDEDVDITGWKIYSGREIETLSGIVPARGYFLLEASEETTDAPSDQILSQELSSTYRLFLTNENERVMDGIFSFSESAYMLEGRIHSFERISPYSFGLDYENWKLNNGQAPSNYDRDSNQVYATPKAKNSNYLIYVPIGRDFVEDFYLPRMIDGETETFYYFHGYVEIFEGVTLTIEPGTIIKFGAMNDANHGLVVRGTLKAKGTADQPIIFTPFGDDYWGGIAIESRGRDTEIDNVIIQKAGFGVYDGTSMAAIRVYHNPSVVISNTIVENGVVGVYLTGSDSIITGCVINGNKKFGQTNGIGLSLKGSSPIITNTQIFDNYYGMYLKDIFINGVEIKSHPQMDGVSIFGNEKADIYPTP